MSNEESTISNNNDNGDELLDVEIEENKEEEQEVEKFSWFNMIKDCFVKFSVLGGTSFVGGIGILQIECCDNWKWLSEKQWMEIYTVAQLLPGATKSQVAFGMALLKYGYVSGFLSNIFFNAPGFILNLLFGILFYNININENSPLWVKNAQYGLTCSGIAFAASSAYRLALYLERYDKIIYFLAGFVSFMTLLYKPMWFLPFLVVFGGIFTWIYYTVSPWLKKRIEVHKKQLFTSKGKLGWREKFKLSYLIIKNIRKPLHSISDDNEEETGQDNERLEAGEIEEEAPRPVAKLTTWNGIINLLILIIIFVILFVAVLATQNVQENIWILLLRVNEFFYRMGALIFGGGVAGVPMIRDELVANKWLTDKQFINGYSISNALPGVRFNSAAFYGPIIASNRLSGNSSLLGNNTIIDNNTVSSASIIIWPIVFGILSGLSFQIPGYLSMVGFMSIWSKIRDFHFIKKAIIGINAVCVGYVITNIIDLWMSNVGSSSWLGANAILCLMIVWFTKVSPPIVVLLSAVSGITLGFIKGGEII
ncbi:hypothetical protein ABK040_005361 [Willaertia magna]